MEPTETEFLNVLRKTGLPELRLALVPRDASRNAKFGLGDFECAGTAGTGGGGFDPSAVERKPESTPWTFAKGALGNLLDSPIRPGKAQ